MHPRERKKEAEKGKKRKEERQKKKFINEVKRARYLVMWAEYRFTG